MWRRAAAMTGTVVVLLTATSTSVATATPTGQSVAASTVAVLADPARSGHDLVLPTDFHLVMGYEPVEEPGPSGRPVTAKSDATCSSPLGATRYDFGQACRVHDLGYDLLRYAAIKGEPLGSSARRSLDAAFGSRMREQCGNRRDPLDRVGCLATAAVYEGAVVANSWRQGFAAPRPESPWALLIPGVLATLPIAPSLWRWARRRRVLLSARRTR